MGNHLLVSQLSLRFSQYVIASGASIMCGCLLYLVRPLKQYLPPFVLYNLSDGLWALGFALLLCGIWHRNKVIFLWLFLFLCTAVSMEWCQAHAFIPGTFDSLDIIMYVAGISIAGMFHFCKSKTNE